MSSTEGKARGVEEAGSASLGRGLRESTSSEGACGRTRLKSWGISRSDLDLRSRNKGITVMKKMSEKWKPLYKKL